MNRRKLFLLGAAAIVLAVVLGGCSLGSSKTVLIRSDPPLNGMQSSVKYTINSNPEGTSEVNQSVYQGVNGISPLPLLTTTFGRGAGVKTETVQATGPNGTAENVLGMSKRQIQFGLTDFLVAELATYEMRDAQAKRVCGAKVRMTFQPSLAQRFLQDKLGRAWDVLWYYNVPCDNQPGAPLQLQNAKLEALVIDQVLNIRITGKPMIWNRGHSVTIVGGKPTTLAPGWWTSNAMILNVAAPMIRDMVRDLDTKSNNWLQFSPDGQFASSKLVYSAGDADVYLSFRRVFLNRQSDYVVHFRGDPKQPWHVVVVKPKYNFEWNDFSQNWRALKGQAFPNIDSKIDNKTGLPKDAQDVELKEIETAGCQNCPNATLEQIQLLDGNTGRPLYAMTIRGYLGANSSLVMFGQVPRVSVEQALNEAEARRADLGYISCPVMRDENGKRLSGDQQISPDHCTKLLREGSLWDLLTQDPNKFGFDVVGQFQVRDNSTWVSRCSGSGNSVFCSSVPVNQKLDASYLFNRTDQKLTDAWTVMQLLGEVGVRTLGVSYASGLYSGSGLLFGMEQPMMYRQYYSGITNSEMVFAFDARALQLPQTIAAATNVLYGG